MLLIKNKVGLYTKDKMTVLNRCFFSARIKNYLYEKDFILETVRLRMIAYLSCIPIYEEREMMEHLVVAPQTERNNKSYRWDNIYQRPTNILEIRSVMC